MASKRKRESGDESMISPPAKQTKEEEVTRSGRVRKKPSKFKDEEERVDPGIITDIKTEPGVTGATPMTVQEMLLEPKFEPEPVQEEMVTPIRQAEMAQFIDEEFGKSGGGRTGRARKKSAKVLEMEEFEEAERKSLKKEVLKKGATPTQVPQKKTPKSPTSPALPISPPHSSTKVKINSPPAFTSPGTTQISPPKKNTSPKSPIGFPGQISQGEGKGSVIKLLLSSPAQTTTSIMPSSTVSQVSPTSDKPVPTSTKKKGKMKEKSTTEILVTSPVGSLSHLKQTLQMAPQPVVVKTESLEDMSVSSLLKMEKTPIKIEKVKVAKEPKIKKEKKSPKEQPISNTTTLPSPNVIHVGSMNFAGVETKPELEIVSSKKKRATKVKVERDDESMMFDEYELEYPDIGPSEPGDDAFIKMEDDNLEIPSEEFEMKPKPAKKKKMAKEKGDKFAVTAESLAEMPSSELVMDFSRMKSADKKKKKAVKEVPEDIDKSKKKRAPTAYTLWCNINRPKVVADNPGIDFSSISKTLGEMWSSLPEKEKLVWKRKAKKAAGKGSTLITTGKAAVPKGPTPQILPVSKPSKETLQKITVVQSTPAPAKQQKVAPDDVNVPLKGFGKEPVDVAAHLKIVGESLSIIGMKLQEHRGLIAVQGSLSVLLDSMLCAVAPLMCLTSILPETDGLPEHVHMKNLDNIAYIMPGL